MVLLKYFNSYKRNINGKSMQDFMSKLDYSLLSSERKNLLYNILYTQNSKNVKFIDSYFEEYFNDIFNTNVNKSDSLSNNDNICNSLEIMANYLLYSPDIEKSKKIQYNFYSKKQLRNTYGKELPLDVLLEKTYESCDDESISFLVTTNNNYKVAIQQKIFSDDIKNIKPICEYEIVKTHLSAKLKNLRFNKTNKLAQKKIVKLLKELKSDQILCKDKIKKTIYFKSVGKDSCGNDFDKFDFNNPQHIINILNCNNSLLTDIGCLKYDVMNVIKNIKFTNKDLKILRLYIRGYVTKDISDMLNLNHRNVQAKIKIICKKIIKQYHSLYQDWYYTYIKKGVYKQCVDCKQIKLANKYNFYIRNDKKGDTFFNHCIDCYKVRKSSQK